MVLGRSWPVLGRSWEVLGQSWAVLGAYWVILERSEANMWIFAGFTRGWDTPGREDMTPGEANVVVFGAWGKPTGRGTMTAVA